MLTCDVCGGPLERRSSRQKRHLGACQRAHASRVQRERRAARTPDEHEADLAARRVGPWRGVRTCRFCGEDFEAKVSWSEVCYAVDCQRQKNASRVREYLRRYREEHGVSYAWAKYPKKRRAAVAARKALVRGAQVGEVFDPRDVFDRDGWVCGLCGDPIDPALAFPDPGSASLDHVLPVSKGGSHSLDNVQPSHLSCNASKGARVS